MVSVAPRSKLWFLANLCSILSLGRPAFQDQPESAACNAVYGQTAQMVKCGTVDQVSFSLVICAITVFPICFSSWSGNVRWLALARTVIQ